MSVIESLIDSVFVMLNYELDVLGYRFTMLNVFVFMLVGTILAVLIQTLFDFK